MDAAKDLRYRTERALHEEAINSSREEAEKYSRILKEVDELTKELRTTLPEYLKSAADKGKVRIKVASLSFDGEHVPGGGNAPLVAIPVKMNLWHETANQAYVENRLLVLGKVAERFEEIAAELGIHLERTSHYSDPKYFTLRASWELAPDGAIVIPDDAILLDSIRTAPKDAVLEVYGTRREMDGISLAISLHRDDVDFRRRR